MRTRAERGLHLRLLCRELALPAPPSVPLSHTGIWCQSGCRVWHRPGPGRVGGKDHRTRVRVPYGPSCASGPDWDSPSGVLLQESAHRQTPDRKTPHPEVHRLLDGVSGIGSSRCLCGMSWSGQRSCASLRFVSCCLALDRRAFRGPPISLPITCRTPLPQTDAPNNHEEAHDPLAGSTLAGSTVIDPGLGRPPRRRGAVKAPAVKADRQDAEMERLVGGDTPHKTVLGVRTCELRGPSNGSTSGAAPEAKSASGETNDRPRPRRR